MIDILKKGAPTLFILVDNMRYDHWKAFEPHLNAHYKKIQEEPHYSILPTATHAIENVFNKIN